MDDGRRLGLCLDERVDEFALLLGGAPMDGIDDKSQAWLRMQYAEIVPLVLPHALRSVESGEPLPPECLSALRDAAARAAGRPGARFSTVLRGAFPALQVFSVVIHGTVRVDASCLVLAMTRGARVAHELGSCWAESWMNATSGVDSHLEDAARVSVSCDADVAEAPIELVTTDPELDEAEQRMLTLTAYGLSNAEIAQATSYSRQAVGWHLGKLMRAWKAPNRTALVAVAFVKGVIVAKIAKPSAPKAIQAGTPPPPPPGPGS